MKMRPLLILGGAAAGMLICLGATGVALAQDASSPPGRVAQLSYTEGSVSLEPAGTSTWTSAALNRPLTTGDRLWSDENSRAELDIGDAVIRLGSMTGFSFLDLDQQTAQMQVTAGTAIVHVRSLSSGGQDEIDTPNLALTLEQPGTYRVEVSDTGDTTIVKVDEGEALATGGGDSFPVAAQQSVTFFGTSVLTADYATLGVPDALDDWSMQRDQEEAQQAAVAQQYVSPDVVGENDLGSYGTWQSTPDWGYAWFPTVPVGWVPYSVGNWVWISPWGWSWVDEEPWGFAPFHYGRWGYWHRRWCWIPGPRHKHPVYAPALVAWVGGRQGGVPRTHVGWFPLGPHDVYVPSYHASAAYVRNINLANTRITNTANITNAYKGHVGDIRYANSAVPGAVTAVPRNVFTSAQPVAPHRVILPHRGGIRVRATTAAPAISPLRASVLGVNAGRTVRAPPRALVDRPVVARLAPARAPVPFAREQAAIRSNGGRPIPMAELARLRPNTPAAPVRLAPLNPAGRRGLELRTAPDVRGAPIGQSMSGRERILQQPTLPPARTPRNDRPPWVQRRPIEIGTPVRAPHPPTVAPREQAPSEWRTPPQREAAPPRQAPAPRFVPQPRQRAEERFVPQPRQQPQERFTPPRQFQPREFRPPAPQAAPARAPERQVPRSRPSDRPPPRAEAAPLASGAGYAVQWQSPPPMYRPQEDTIHYATPPPAIRIATPYRPPSSPPPMYRPVPFGNGAPAPRFGAGRIPRGHGRGRIG